MRWHEQMRQTGVKNKIANHFYTTGWWGMPGDHSMKGFTKVHLYDRNNRGPACGANLRKGMVYQWCAGGIKWDYLECEHCKRIARNFLSNLHVKPSEWA